MADPGQSIDSVLIQAARLTAEGRPESAIAVLRPALQLFPGPFGRLVPAVRGAAGRGRADRRRWRRRSAR